MGRGMAIPKGRYNLPREAKRLVGDRILVFAEGKAAEEAKRAGADVVGGPEIVDAVREFKSFCSTSLINRTYRWSAGVSKRACIFARQISSVLLRLSLVVSSVLEV